MRKYKKWLVSGVILIVIGYVVYSFVDKGPGENAFDNQVTIVSKVDISWSERDQLAKSVDQFMNEYKLPKGVQNTYSMTIEKRLNDSIEISTMVLGAGADDSVVIFAKKTSGVWQVDPNGGPWCTIETFDNNTCF